MWGPLSSECPSEVVSQTPADQRLWRRGWNPDRVGRRRPRACVSDPGGRSCCWSHGSFREAGLLHTSRASDVGEARVQRVSAGRFHQHPLRGRRSAFQQRGPGLGVVSRPHRRVDPEGTLEAHEVAAKESPAKVKSLFLVVRGPFRVTY